MAINDQTLDVVASELEGHFVTQKRQIISRYEATNRDKKAFLKAAEICVLNNFDTRLYIMAQMDDSSPEKYQAAWLHSYNAVRKYELYKEKHVTEVAVGSLYEHYNQYLMRLIQLGQDYMKVLHSQHHDIPAWYRIVVTTEPDEEIIKKFVDQARKEMKNNPNIEQFILEEPTLTKSLERLQYGR